MRICEFKGCYKKHQAKGYCRKHYNHFCVDRKWDKKIKCYKTENIDWEAINIRATKQFEEWKKTAIPFKVDDGEFRLLKTY